MKRAIAKCRKLKSDINNTDGVGQADKALQAMQQPRRKSDPRIKEEEELALRQMMSGITPEWQEEDKKHKKGTIAVMGLWTGEMMNWARTHMKIWI
eukprot:6202055-Pleurochrysis_carterae.AAC.1